MRLSVPALDSQNCAIARYATQAGTKKNAAGDYRAAQREKDRYRQAGVERQANKSRKSRFWGMPPFLCDPCDREWLKVSFFANSVP